LGAAKLHIYRVVSHKEYFSLVHWIDNSTNDILLDDLPYPHGRGLIRYNVSKLTSNDHHRESRLADYFPFEQYDKGYGVNKNGVF